MTFYLRSNSWIKKEYAEKKINDQEDKWRVPYMRVMGIVFVLMGVLFLLMGLRILGPSLSAHQKM